MTGAWAMNEQATKQHTALEQSFREMLRDKKHETILGTFLTTAGMAMYTLVAILVSSAPSMLMLGIGAVFVLGFWLNLWILQFRITNGFYGSNSREAREFINWLHTKHRKQKRRSTKYSL